MNNKEIKIEDSESLKKLYPSLEAGSIWNNALYQGVLGYREDLFEKLKIAEHYLVNGGDIHSIYRGIVFEFTEFFNLINGGEKQIILSGFKERSSLQDIQGETWSNFPPKVRQVITDKTINQIFNSLEYAMAFLQYHAETVEIKPEFVSRRLDPTPDIKIK